MFYFLLSRNLLQKVNPFILTGQKLFKDYLNFVMLIGQIETFLGEFQDLKIHCIQAEVHNRTFWRKSGKIVYIVLT